MHNMMYGGGMMGASGYGVITTLLVWALLVVAIIALWTWIKKNK